ncbi:MAG: PAS domain-containing protein [Flavobacterium sp.]|uniref:PAS domain-containing protein n=1 Tax=Flavobacterium sp. TaxID=239 RepID=UPI003263A5C7
MNSKITNPDIQFLAGGGEMGRLTREKDWSQNSLGNPETWPQSLRTTLSILLNSKFPMFLFWGPELICFYNDAYRPSLGNDGKHPNILGGRGEDFWKEIWKDIKPLIDQVLEKGEATWFEDLLLPIYRNGKMEDVYWTFSYSPVNDESGKPAGVFVTCSETTEKVNVLKQLNESNKRYLNNIMQAPLAMCIFKGKDFVVEIANDMMLEVWGKKAEDVINKPVFEGVPEAKGQNLEILLEDVFNTGEKFVANERPIQLLRNGKIETTYINFVYEAIHESDGTISGVVAAATEVTKQVLDRIKLEETEQKVRALVENAPFAIAVYTGEEMRVELANQTIIDIWGKGNDVIGKTFTEILPELKGQLVFEQIKEVYKSGKAFHTQNTPLELIVDGKRGTYYFNYSFTPLYDLSGKVYGVMNTGVDLTDLNMAKRKIEASDKKFRTTLQQAPVAIAIFRGKDYVAEMANDAYLELVDRKESDFIGRPLFDSLPEVKETVQHLLDDVFNTGVPFHGNEIPAPIMRNGEIGIFNFDLLYHPLREEDGTISGIIVTAAEVTEKVQARNKTEQNEQRLNIVIEASELGTWELNVKTREATYSDRYLEIIGGYTEPVKLTHDQLLAHLHPDDLGIRNKAVKDAIATGYLNYEARMIWKDKSIHWMEGKGKVFYDADGEAEKMIGTIRDITSEKNQQQLLMDSERKFRLLSDSMPQHIWTADTEGNLNYFNKSVVEYSGLSLAQIFKKGWLDIVHPDDREENVKRWMNAITTGKDFLFEHRFRRHDGKFRWQLSRAIPQKDENGEILMWVGTSTDIHDQKNFAAELETRIIERTKELELTNQHLQQSEERYHLMVEEVQDYAILYINKEGTIENWNKGAEKIKGYKAGEIIGKNFSQFYTIEDRASNLPQYLLSQAVKNGRSRQEGWRLRKDGSLFWASVTITAVHNNTGEVIGFSKVTHDLSAKKEADDKIKQNTLDLEQKNQELEKMNRELQSFAYISSHDLQEPLRKIQTFSDQIIQREAENLSESGKDKFQRMQNAAHRMQNLINDLLAYSRTNIQERNLIATDLNKIVENIKDDLSEELLQSNATIEAEKLKCDVEIIPFQFYQLLFNLVSNSLKFSKPDVPPKITIKCEIQKGKKLNNENLLSDVDYCHITFSDNGIGFEQQYSERIFEVFQRLHGKEVYMGTGIGLAIVKKIIDNHNGIITATGKLGEGATFDIIFPVKG